jgi:hypothetical protein
VKRLVRLGEWDSEVGEHLDRTAITPNENAAATIGAPPTSLEILAREVLGEERIAHLVSVQQLLGEAVKKVLGSADPDGVARTVLPPIRELFRAGTNLDADPGTPRSQRTFDVARYYRARLRAQGLIDPAEALWEAAQSSPERRPFVVWGYPRLGRDEAAFVDAVSGEGSVVYLPYAEDHTFDENLETAESLERCGWMVERANSQAAWEMGFPVEAHVYPHLEAEVRGVLAQVKVLLVDGVSPQDVVLVARDDAFYGPTVLSVAREYGVPVQALYRVPVSDTRVGYWLHLLFEAVAEGFPFETTARVLAHPLGPGLTDKVWREVRRVRPRGAVAWEEAGVSLPFPAWPEEDTRAGWVYWFGALLESHALKKKAASWSREVSALAALREGVGWIGEPAEERISRYKSTHFTEHLNSGSAPC